MSNSAMKQKYQEIVQMASVKEVIESYGLTLIKKGKDYKTACPFHNDHDPSLSIRSDDKVWKCFVCNEGGNAITFVQKYESKVLGNRNFTIFDAMKKVVDICHLDIDLSQIKGDEVDQTRFTHNARPYTPHQQVLLSQLNAIMNTANFYLINSTDERGRNYLQQRGFDEKLMEELKFGFLPKEQIQQMINKQSFPLSNLVDMGFVGYNEESNRYYPIFGDRILIPIFDEQGNAVTFSGRAIFGEDPKYLHGHNTSIFRKSNQLYNYHRAKNYAYGDKIYVVEGFMDVAGGNKIGIENIVATMGTSFSKEQLDMVKRLNCEIVLVRDNDKAGKEAMLKEIPELLKDGFKVSAVDLAEVKRNMNLPDDIDTKDLWDFANAGITSEILTKNTVSAFHFMLSNQYFKDKELITESIRQIFTQLKDDNYITTEADKMSFKDYVSLHSTYNRDEIENILSDEPLQENAFTRFQANIMMNYIHQKTLDYIKEHGDSIMESFYKEEHQGLITKMHEQFANNPNSYLNKDYTEIDIQKLVKDTFNTYEKWKNFEILHNFQHDNIFDHVFVKNESGQSIPIELNSEQKRAVTKQFDDSLSNDVRLSLGEVDELYIYNNVDDLDKILNLSNTNQGSLILKSMKQQCMMRDTIMHVFSFDNVFDKEMLFAIDSQYKSADGQRYKKILLFDNRIEKIQITKENLKQEQSKTKEAPLDTKENKEIEEPKEEIQEKTSETRQLADKEMVFTINYKLISRQTNDNYFVRIPGTRARYYMYIPKEWTTQLSEETLRAKIPTNLKVDIFDKSGYQQAQWSTDKLFHYWEEKPKKEKNSLFKKWTGFASNKAKNEISYTPFNGYNISSNRIISMDDKMCTIHSRIEGYRLIMPRKYLEKNTRYSYNLKSIPEITTANGKVSDIRLTKETKDGLQFMHTLSFNELDKHLCEKENPKMLLLVANAKKVNEIDHNYLRVPVWVDRKYCYVILDKASSKPLDEHHIGYYSTPYHEFPLYNKDEKQIDSILGKDLGKLHEEAMKERIDLEQDYDIERGE